MWVCGVRCFPVQCAGLGGIVPIEHLTDRPHKCESLWGIKPPPAIPLAGDTSSQLVPIHNCILPERLMTFSDSLAVIINHWMNGSAQRTPCRTIKPRVSPVLHVHRAEAPGWCSSCAVPPLLPVVSGSGGMRWWWCKGLVEKIGGGTRGWRDQVLRWPCGPGHPRCMGADARCRSGKPAPLKKRKKKKREKLQLDF